MWEQYDILVASIDTAKREPHNQYVLKQHYDLLIVDEAHKLKNRRTKNWQFINQIQKKYCLLLTATPVQNEIQELYNLVTLLKPGQLGKETDFNSDYKAGKRKAKNEEQLRAEISRVLIRNRRKNQNMHMTKRIVQTIPIPLSEEERKLYDGVTQFIRDRFRQGGDLKSMLSLLVLQKEVCSSRDAVFHTLFKMFKQSEAGKETLSPEVAHLVDLLRSVKRSSKVDTAIQLIKSIPDKVILFTEYRATQEMILRELTQHGIPAVPYRGGFNRNKKDWMMELFKKRAKVMVATEAGGEGINLQFCHHIINYDMPWNPMRVEQRIGRVHRLGQTNDVYIYNLATIGTIEEHIIWLLQEKIQLFETVIGELETILENLDLEQHFLEIMMEADNYEEIRDKLSQWGDQFAQKWKEVQKSKEEQEEKLYGAILR
jgi:SNF2 family DNA or RNA helicase